MLESDGDGVLLASSTNKHGKDDHGGEPSFKSPGPPDPCQDTSGPPGLERGWPEPGLAYMSPSCDPYLGLQT
jgi:hypothetical protein